MLWQGHVRNTLFHFCQLPPVNFINTIILVFTRNNITEMFPHLLCVFATFNNTIIDELLLAFLNRAVYMVSHRSISTP